MLADGVADTFEVELGRLIHALENSRVAEPVVQSAGRLARDLATAEQQHQDALAPPVEPPTANNTPLPLVLRAVAADAAASGVDLEGFAARARRARVGG